MRRDDIQHRKLHDLVGMIERHAASRRGLRGHGPPCGTGCSPGAASLRRRRAPSGVWTGWSDPACPQACWNRRSRAGRRSPACNLWPRSGAIRRQVITECGAPWNISTGGPEPPITALISAPEVLIRSLRKPERKNFMHGEGVPDAGDHAASSAARVAVCKKAAAPATNAVFGQQLTASFVLLRHNRLLTESPASAARCCRPAFRSARRRGPESSPADSPSACPSCSRRW